MFANRDIAFGTQHGVTGTSTMFINSESVAGIVASEQLRTLIKEARSQPSSTEISSR
jgi:hypothetical protein